MKNTRFVQTARRVAAATVGLGAALTVGFASTASAAPLVKIPTISDFLPYPLVVNNQTAFPDREANQPTADGWNLRVNKTGESLYIAAPLDGAVTTAEAFATLRGGAWIEGQGDPAIDSGLFEMGYQLGCGVDISGGVDVQATNTIGLSPAASVNPSASNTTTLDGIGLETTAEAPYVSVELPKINNATTVGVDGNLGVDGNAEHSHTISGHIDPGSITNIALASREVNTEYNRANASVVGAHITTTGCVGPVTVRSYVLLSTETATSSDIVAVYGDPQRLR